MFGVNGATSSDAVLAIDEGDGASGWARPETQPNTSAITVREVRARREETRWEGAVSWRVGAGPNPILKTGNM